MRIVLGIFCGRNEFLHLVGIDSRIFISIDDRDEGWRPFVEIPARTTLHKVSRAKAPVAFLLAAATAAFWQHPNCDRGATAQPEVVEQLNRAYFR